MDVKNLVLNKCSRCGAYKKKKCKECGVIICKECEHNISTEDVTLCKHWFECLLL